MRASAFPVPACPGAGHRRVRGRSCGIGGLTIPRSNPINAFTMGGIIRDAGMTIEEFKNLL